MHNQIMLAQIYSIFNVTVDKELSPQGSRFFSDCLCQQSCGVWIPVKYGFLIKAVQFFRPITSVFMILAEIVVVTFFLWGKKKQSKIIWCTNACFQNIQLRKQMLSVKYLREVNQLNLMKLLDQCLCSRAVKGKNFPKRLIGKIQS